MFNNIVAGLFTGCLSLVTHARNFCIALHCIGKRVCPSHGFA